jgi:hypothetical protein
VLASAIAPLARGVSLDAALKACICSPIRVFTASVAAAQKATGWAQTAR